MSQKRAVSRSKEALITTIVVVVVPLGSSQRTNQAVKWNVLSSTAAAGAFSARAANQPQLIHMTNKSAKC